MWLHFVSSPLTLAVKLHNFTVFLHKIMYESCVEKNLLPLILHIFPIFDLPPPPLKLRCRSRPQYAAKGLKRDNIDGVNYSEVVKSCKNCAAKGV